jgi:hypothetical protein
MGRFRDTMVNGPLGVTRQEAQRLQGMLEPGEQLHYAFEVETKLNWRTFSLYVLSKGAVNTTGRVLVLITDRSLLLVDVVEQYFGEKGDRLLYADLPLPPTFGPVSGGAWIVLDRKPVRVTGGRTVVEKAEAALREATHDARRPDGDARGRRT